MTGVCFRNHWASFFFMLKNNMPMQKTAMETISGMTDVSTIITSRIS